MRDHMRTELTSAALMMARQRQRPSAGLLCHSDRGSQYAAEAYRRQLADIQAIPSMSRAGGRYLFACIEGYYNRQRLHSALGYIKPEQAERNAGQPPCPRKRVRITRARWS